MKLQQLQTIFLKEIFGEDAGLSNEIIEHGDLNSKQRIHVYQHAYVARLYGVLEVDYPNLGLLLGDELFDGLIYSYIKSHTSRSPSINYYGSGLPSFIRSHAPLAEQKIAIELCDLEWQLRTTFDAKNGKILQDDFLQSVPGDEWPGLQFEGMPGLKIHNFSMNTVDVWQSLKDQKVPTVEKLSVPQTWVIWRHDLITQFRSLDVDEACTLKLALEGSDFEMLCEELLEWHSEESVPARAFQLLDNWIKTEMLTRRT